jgi:hypothetical protein
MSKVFGALAPVVLGGMWYGGLLGAAFAEEVDRPPAQVMAALADLDIRRQPGNPGTDPSRSGGVLPVFRTERTADTITFIVMSGDQVATRMIAYLEPLDGGRRTRVTAGVDRGDAPDERVSPAFQSEGLTLGLFQSAITDELRELTAPPPATAEACEALQARITEENMAAGDPNPPRSFTEGFGQTMRNIGRIRDMEKRLREGGCIDTTRRAGDPFSKPRSYMTEGTSPPGFPSAPEPISEQSREGVNFKPGAPMVDVSR